MKKNVLVGYARVSTDKQNLDLQIDALTEEGCFRIFKDVISIDQDLRRPSTTCGRGTPWWYGNWTDWAGA